jgi:uncharacterized protein (DUF433 family)
MGRSSRRFWKGYPDLEREDIRQAIEYEARLTEEKAHIS